MYKKNIRTIEVNPRFEQKKEQIRSEGPRARKKQKTGFLVKKMEEFCKRTDLHGYKYIVMRELTVLER